jgi:restriction system protein
MPIPDYQSLMLPVLLATPQTEIRIGDVIARLADDLKVTPEERAQLLPSGVQGLFANRVHWAKFYSSKAGLIESTRRGHFKLTREGEKVIESKPDRIDNNFLSQFEAFEKFKQKKASANQLRFFARAARVPACVSCRAADRRRPLRHSAIATARPPDR